MRCPTLAELPPPPPGKSGWPWTEESEQLPETMPALSGAEGLSGEPWPRVSIVTPSYNQGQFIEETIRSVLLQGYPDLEYIIMDGGSTDGSVEIIRKYTPWLAYWVSEKDNGQSAAINKGFRQVSGGILAWLNSDDVYLPNAFGTIVPAMVNRADTALIYGDVEAIDRSGLFLRQFGHIRSFSMDWMLTQGNIIMQPGAFFRAEYFWAVGALDETLNNVMDYDLWIRLGQQYDVQYVPVSLAQARLYAETKTASTGKRRFTEIEQTVRKYGAKHLPENWAQELAGTYLDHAAQYYERLKMKEARNEIFYVLRHAPAYHHQAWVIKLLLRTCLPSQLVKAVRHYRG
jgi:glycosyltransferase involved in cell wall biosynthesis